MFGDKRFSLDNPCMLAEPLLHVMYISFSVNSNPLQTTAASADLIITSDAIWPVISIRLALSDLTSLIFEIHCMYNHEISILVIDFEAV